MRGTLALLLLSLVAIGIEGRRWVGNKKDKTATIDCRCGLANYPSKIVGGSLAGQNKYPWQVGLVQTLSSRTTYCGGSLISDQDVLTGVFLQSVFLQPTDWELSTKT